jgi:hypothetical protein
VCWQAWGQARLLGRRGADTGNDVKVVERRYSVCCGDMLFGMFLGGGLGSAIASYGVGGRWGWVSAVAGDV